MLTELNALDPNIQLTFEISLTSIVFLPSLEAFGFFRFLDRASGSISG